MRLNLALASQLVNSRSQVSMALTGARTRARWTAFPFPAPFEITLFVITVYRNVTHLHSPPRTEPVEGRGKGREGAALEGFAEAHAVGEDAAAALVAGLEAVDGLEDGVKHELDALALVLLHRLHEEVLHGDEGRPLLVAVQHDLLEDGARRALLLVPRQQPMEPLLLLLQPLPTLPLRRPRILRRLLQLRLQPKPRPPSFTQKEKGRERTSAMIFLAPLRLVGLPSSVVGGAFLAFPVASPSSSSDEPSASFTRRFLADGSAAPFPDLSHMAQLRIGSGQIRKSEPGGALLGLGLVLLLLLFVIVVGGAGEVPEAAGGLRREVVLLGVDGELRPVRNLTVPPGDAGMGWEKTTAWTWPSSSPPPPPPPPPHWKRPGRRF